MKIYARFTHPNAGTAFDQTCVKRAHLRPNAIYNLASAEIGGFHSTVMLENIQGVFNSCHFDFCDSEGNEVDIYHMKGLAHLCDHESVSENM